jgi:signal transduction histidine kinase
VTRPDRSQIRGALIDVPVAAVLTQQIASAALDGPGPDWTGPGAVAWLVAVALGLPLVARRRWPLPVFAVVVTVAAAATAAGVTAFGVMFLTWIPVALALYSAAAAVADRAGAVPALAAALAAPAVTIVWLYRRTGVTPASAPSSEAPLWWQVELGLVVVMLAAAWAAGRLIRWRRDLAADAARRAARDAVADERLRIARELHDIVGHSLSLIAVKATVANHIAEERPAETRAALVTIEKTSRSALTEIRRLLDVLREDDDPAELAPSPGAGDLPALVERLRSAGPRIELHVTGAGDLPPAVGLTVYRIVQESLTNVIKHADASRCRVEVRAGGGAVHIEVTDDGRGRPAPRRRRGGQGLIGMRERVTMYGGSLSADARPEGGFQVAAVIPYTPDEETP